MAEHRVFFELPTTELGKADATFQVKRDGKILGTIHISHGALEYQPNGFMKKNSIKIDWTKFDKLMRESDQ
ncbi:hypothetical protein SAMN05428949_2174 [Chitinophaga sp. YR627]|jgi:hypothetical protein|uniref:hypothetical protein n=1 Tax=Chitinophaga sp. YR627 TaxID=1881041 RepID=UPI0008DFDDA7|nr:hypothetical protein [Chitinophaga sp. YR627]SFN26335.1 hypothetical protein SAMN05428949_2174 [Chitinophaga sp. YR627]